MLQGPYVPYNLYPKEPVSSGAYAVLLLRS